MLRGTININNLRYNPEVLKKVGKTSKKLFFGPNSNLHRKKVIMGHGQDGNFFSGRNKSRSSAFRKFLFYQNIICFD